MYRSTRDITDWRTMYPGNRMGTPDEPTLQMWDYLRKRSMAAQDTVNRMPYVFDPGGNSMKNADEIKQVIRPGSAPALSSAPAPAAQIDLPGLLQALQQNPQAMSLFTSGPALAALFGGRSG